MQLKLRSMVGFGLAVVVGSVHCDGVFAGTHKGDQRAHPSQTLCAPTGVYVGAVPGQATFTMTNLPLDAAASDVMLTIDTTGYEPTFDGMFPTAVGQTLLRGFATRSRRNVYRGQLVRYRYDATRAVVATEVQAIDLSQETCDQVEIHFVARLFYFGFVNVGDSRLPEPDFVFDVTGAPPTIASKMQPYASNQPSP